jgi:uncharacterized short protein YbdD (DUF466 family)
MRTPLRMLEQVLQYAKDVTGESDYDRYLDHLRTSGHPGQPLSRKAWFRQRTEERYADNAIRRCC